MPNFLRSSHRKLYIQSLEEELSLAEDLLEDYNEQLVKHAKYIDTPEHLSEPNTTYLSGDFEAYDDDRWEDQDSPEDYLKDLTGRYFHVANIAQQLRDLSEEKGYGKDWVPEPALQLSESYKQFEDELLSIDNVKGKELETAHWAIKENLRANLTDESSRGGLVGRSGLGWRYKDGRLQEMPRWARLLKPSQRLFEQIEPHLDQESTPSYIPTLNALAPKDARVKRPHRPVTGFNEGAEVKGSLPDGVSLRQAGYGKKYGRKK